MEKAELVERFIRVEDSIIHTETFNPAIEKNHAGRTVHSYVVIELMRTLYFIITRSHGYSSDPFD